MVAVAVVVAVGVVVAVVVAVGVVVGLDPGNVLNLDEPPKVPASEPGVTRPD